MFFAIFFFVVELFFFFGNWWLRAQLPVQMLFYRCGEGG